MPAEQALNPAIIPGENLAAQSSKQPSPEASTESSNSNQHNTASERIERNDNEEDVDINEFFDWERFEKDNEESNLHWTGRTY